MELEEAIEKLLELKKGNEEVINTESKIFHKSNDEDTQHYKDEIEAIEIVINDSLKNKARADKMEKDYSKALTRIDKLKADLYEANNIISDYIDTTTKQEKMIDLMGEELAFGVFDFKSKEQVKQYFEKKAEESE